MSAAVLGDGMRPGVYAVSSETIGEPLMYGVRVPANTPSGSTFTFTAGNRHGLLARCPPSVNPGQLLQVVVSPEPKTHHIPLKAAPLTSMTMESKRSIGGAVPMTEAVRKANQALLELASNNTDGSFVVVVPPSVQPGQQFVAQTPHQQQFLVTCPPDAGPNQPIRIKIPPTPNSEEEEEEEVRVPPPPPPAAAAAATANKIFKIKAPEGVLPNQVLPVLVCGKRIPVKLPDNVLPGQTVKLKLPIESFVDAIDLAYDETGWHRTIRMSDLKFQWVRTDNDNNNNNNDNNKNSSNNSSSSSITAKLALCRQLVLLEGNDKRMRTGSVQLVPANQAVAESELVHCNRTMVSYATISHIQAQSFERKTEWFQTLCQDLIAPWDNGRIKIVVRREHLLEDSVQAIMSLGRADMLRKWRLNFYGEPAIDSGGVMREWFQLVTKQIFDPDLGLWLSSINNQICMTVNPGSDISCPDDHLIHFRFIGRIMGRALVDRQLVQGHMVRHYYKHVLGWPITFDDLQAQDEEYYNSLRKLASSNASDIESLCLDFTLQEETMLGVRRVIELVPGGGQKSVTSENLSEYLEAILRYRMLGSTKPQITEILLGFFDVIPEPALMVFDPSELELLLCGTPTIDMDDWESNTIYKGLYQGHGRHKKFQVVQWFWQVVRNDFDAELKARLLQFVTGTSGVPSRGFSVLQGNDGNIKKFAIQGVNRSEYPYPRAHTCFNRIDLPNYKTKKELYEKLKTAITLCAVGFDLE